MKKNVRRILSLLLTLVLAVVLLTWFLSAFSQLGGDHAAEDKAQLETALTRAAVACYAAEGAYPPSVEYLEEHYGIQINKDLYTVKYEVIASNLMPDITVLENQP